MNDRHTPGPWFVVYEPYGDQDAGIEGYEPSGDLVQGSPTSREFVNLTLDANARLVAAAPELLEALQYALKELTACKDLGMSLNKSIELATAAIAKATP